MTRRSNTRPVAPRLTVRRLSLSVGATASGAYRPVAAACTLGVHESSKAAAWWSRAWWSRYAHRRQRDAAVSYDTTARLDQITVPTLILRGRRDRSLPLPMAEQLHTGITRSQLQVFRGGHMFYFLTERQGLLAFVDEFLTD